MKIALAAFAAALLLTARPAAAHCDGLDGPVVKAARAALARGDVRPALAWVQAGDEAPVRAALERARGVAKLGGEAKALAETYFFETVVRLHRAGEGASYTGLKAAGGVGAGIAAADRALAEGSVERLAAETKEAVEHGLRLRFEEARASAKYAPEDVAAGRAFVKAYVEFLHFVERIHDSAAPRHEH
jgi:hypothetical protein